MNELKKVATSGQGSLSSQSPERGEILVDGDHGAESELHRNLSSRHITMIALGT